MKHMRGVNTSLWVRYNLSKSSPVDCDFSIGDRVVFTNDYGIEFEMDVIGFSDNVDPFGRFIHTVIAGTDGNESAWWFPCHPESLTHIEVTNG